MKNKYILLLTVVALLLVLLLIISSDRKKRENKKVEIEQIEERKQFVQDSIKQVNDKNEELKRIEQENTQKAQLLEAERLAFEKRVDGFTNKSNSKYDIAVLFLNDNGQAMNNITSRIASIYRNKGYSVTSSLFTSSFIQSEFCADLYNSSSHVINMLTINGRVNNLILGKINFSYKEGSLVNNTTVCTANITINIVSVKQKSVVNSFSFSTNGNGVSEAQAREKATNLLINKYQNEYSKI